MTRLAGLTRAYCPPKVGLYPEVGLITASAMREPTAIRATTIIERLGFRPLGEITVGSNGGLRFPAPPDCGGLYFIAFWSGGYYVGETGRYARVGSKPGRFDHYTNPADDIWTELVLSAMLIAGGGGHIHIREEPVAGKFQRIRMEAAVVKDFLGEGVPLWNEGGGRCQNGIDPVSWTP